MDALYERSVGDLLAADVVSTREDHQRAALDFVLELAGHPPPRCTSSSFMGMQLPPLASGNSFVYADELPVPLFAADLNMRCVLWNKRATDLSGWHELEVADIPNFASILFTPQSPSCKRDCEDVLKAAIEVGDSAGQIWNLKTKWGQTLEVFLFASKRTDAVGVVHGAMCVIIPLTVPGTQLECGNLPLENAGDLDSEADQLSTSEDSSGDGSDDQGYEQPPSPYSDVGTDVDDILWGHWSLAAENTSIGWQDWCTNEQGSDISASAVNGETCNPLSSARVLVVDP
ncbi:unnamed protein product [Sphagnum troendelagicum]|uniref:PAS fold domain-containing protein n=1 Tax=Sphagnum troendelagicum TaxID=128251 RepID=A0ABP0TK74_9BRYO